MQWVRGKMGGGMMKPKIGRRAGPGAAAKKTKTDPLMRDKEKSRRFCESSKENDGWTNP